MLLLPFEKFNIETSLKKEEIFDRLECIIEPKIDTRPTGNLAWLTNTKHKKPYEGFMNHKGAELNRIINYNYNSRLPLINILIKKENENGCIVNVKMRPSYGSLILAVALFCLSLYFLITQIIDMIQKNAFQPFSLCLLGTVLFCYFLPVFGFKMESSIAKNDLKRLFKN